MQTSLCFLGYNMAAKCQSDDDVPPLEDMSEVLQSIAELRGEQNTEKIKSTYLEATENVEEAKLRSVQKLLFKDGKGHPGQSAPIAKEISSKPDPKPVGLAKQNQGFGGFKKGFLLSNTRKSDSKKSKEISSAKTEKIEEVKKSEAGKANDPFVFSEVQDAIAAQMPLLKSKDWITEDLLSKVEKNPKLLKQLEDERFSQALTAFQANPQQAMLAVQNDPEVKEFIQEFCGLLGDHFASLGEEEMKKKSSTKRPIETLEASSSRKLVPESKSKATQSEQENFQKIISDPEIREILSDGRIQHLIGVLKENPAVAQRTLSELGPEYHGKIQKLIEAGLLGVRRL